MYWGSSACSILKENGTIDPTEEEQETAQSYLNEGHNEILKKLFLCISARIAFYLSIYLDERHIFLNTPLP